MSVIFTPTDQAQGDHAVYDLDQAVMVMTGHDLRLTTPNDVITARDDLEYWAQKHMAVARGDAVVVTKDARRIAADVLVAYTTPAPATPPAPTPVAAKPAAPSVRRGPARRLRQAGEGRGIRSRLDPHRPPISSPAIAASMCRKPASPAWSAMSASPAGKTSLPASDAEVNLKTGISRLLSGNSGRVQGLIVTER